jgi:4-diphosphocytidyl-2-C-methyl-D-erythritol kinase
MLTLFAYAKINLTLEVLGRRADGYHELMTVFQTAAGVLQEATGCSKGARISIKKGIPLAAGLGGGASDTAATLQALNELWQLSLSREQLLQLAAKVSSDAAFFLYGGTALGEGRGERITPLPPFPPSWVVLLKPPINVPDNKTERLYASLNPSHFASGQFSKSMVELLHRRGEVPSSSLFNTFEQVAFAAFPGLEEYWQRFLDLGADNVHLAGSGPTLFTLTRDRSHGEELYRSLSRKGLEVYLVQTVAEL